jgi:hypothetical protein
MDDDEWWILRGSLMVVHLQIGWTRHIASNSRFGRLGTPNSSSVVVWHLIPVLCIRSSTAQPPNPHIIRHFAEAPKEYSSRFILGSWQNWAIRFLHWHRQRMANDLRATSEGTAVTWHLGSAGSWSLTTWSVCCLTRCWGNRSFSQSERSSIESSHQVSNFKMVRWSLWEWIYIWFWVWTPLQRNTRMKQQYSKLPLKQCRSAGKDWSYVVV